MLAGTPSSRSAAVMALTASPSDAPGARLNEIVAAGNWPRWLITSGALRSLMRAIVSSGTCCPPLAAHVESAERRGTALELGLHLEHDAVLVGLREDRRDEPLAECVVERVVDRRPA